MRRIFKLLLVIGIGLALAKPGGPDGPGNRPGNGGDGPDTPPQKSPSGKIDTAQGTESASQAVQAEAEQGRSQQSESGTDNSSPESDSGRDPKAGPPVDPDDMLPEAGTIADHANERFREGALDHYVSRVPNDQLSTYVHNVMEGNIDGIDTRYGLNNGRVAYYDPETGAVVIEDPGTDHGGTVFSPSDGNNGRTYFDDLT